MAGASTRAAALLLVRVDGRVCARLVSSSYRRGHQCPSSYRGSLLFINLFPGKIRFASSNSGRFRFLYVFELGTYLSCRWCRIMMVRDRHNSIRELAWNVEVAIWSLHEGEGEYPRQLDQKMLVCAYESHISCLSSSDRGIRRKE